MASITGFGMSDAPALLKWTFSRHPGVSARKASVLIIIVRINKNNVSRKERKGIPRRAQSSQYSPGRHSRRSLLLFTTFTHFELRRNKLSQDDEKMDSWPGVLFLCLVRRGSK